MTYNDDYLAHYGVLGMKWGVRKDGRPQGYQGGKSKNRKKKRVISEDKKEVKALLSKHPSELSNTELQKLNKRLELETNYGRLTKTDKSSFEKGYDKVKTGLAVAGTATAIYNLTQSPVVKRAVNIGKQFLNRDLLQITSKPHNR